MVQERNDASSGGSDDLPGALRHWMEEVEDGLREHARDAPWKREPPPPVFGHSQRPSALLNAGAIAAAVVDRRGAVKASTSTFRQSRIAEVLPGDLGRRVSGARALRLELVGEGEGAVVAAYAPSDEAAAWRLPPSIHEAAQTQPDSVIVIGADVGEASQPLHAACQAYGLTDLQSRVAIAAIRAGGIKGAATALGISYQTARESLSAAMKRVGAQRLPGLVTRLATLAFGVLPAQPSSAAVLADLWGLTERQIALAGLVADGLSRGEAAKAMGVSDAVAKKELETAYAILQVGSAAALARKIVEVRAFAWLMQATDGAFGYLDDGAEPLRIIHREDGGQVAFSDYGPASGRPVLVVHSSMTTRIVSRALLRALHAAGFRPIAIDRPGFGLTDPLGDPGLDPWRAAVGDVERVLHHLKLRRLDLVSRGGAQFVTALHQAMPERLGQVVIVNPGPPYRYSGKGKGPFALIKDAMIGNPSITHALAPYLAGLLTHARLTRILEQWTRGSPPDHRAAQDPAIVNDFYRTLRMFAAGRFEGFISEQNAIVSGVRPERLHGAGWRLLLGAHDVLYDPDFVLAYWRDLLPDAEIQIVPDGGRFLAMTHADLVVRTLADG